MTVKKILPQSQKSLSQTLSYDEKKAKLKIVRTSYTEEDVVVNAYKEFEDGKNDDSTTNNIFREMAIREFETGAILVLTLPEMYRSLALSMSKKLQDEFDCKTTSDKSLAEMTSLNYCRILFIQNRIFRYLEKDSVTDIGVGYLKFASQELDRAERHYLTSLQSLKSMRSPPLQVSFRANTAVIGQNQVVQVNENEINKPK